MATNNSNNSLNQDPLTNSNAFQQRVPNLSDREGGYAQENLGPINMAEPVASAPVQSVVKPVETPIITLPTQPIGQPVNTPIIMTPVQPTTVSTSHAAAFMQNPFTQPIPVNNNGPIELAPSTPKIVEEIKKPNDKINIVLVLAIVFGVILLFALIVGVMLMNANNKKTTDNTPVVTQPVVNDSQVDIVSDSKVVIDDTRLVINTPTLNQAISKNGSVLSLDGQMKGFFEGTMNFRILDSAGTELTTGVITAIGDNLTDFTSFNKQATIDSFSSLTATSGKIEFYETSMKDGSITVLASIPLKFQ
jgi:hypothetical protein